MSDEAAAGPPIVYGLDIETDTSVDGLDPTVSRVLAAAISGPGGDIVLAHHDEAALLDELDGWLADLTPGVLVTWNGAAFDLPYLASRAALVGVRLGLRIELDPALGLRGDPLPGHEGAYRGSWHGHRHLDAYRVFRADLGRTFGVSCALKSVAGLTGVPFIDADGSRVHELAPGRLHAYVASDARCARQLAERRWPTAVGAIDAEPQPRSPATSGALA
jgi:hypothetical protein